MIETTDKREKLSIVNRQWRLAARPVGPLKESDFEWRESPVFAPGEGEILVHNTYLSLDPTNQGWASRETYVPPVAIGEVMRGFTIGTVEESRNPRFEKRAVVQGTLGWQDYALSDGTGLTILPKDPSIPLTAYFALFAHIGLSAYFGLLDIGKPNPGETLVVSAAAGAVGSLVGQIGKIKECRVVGIAGSEEKCHWIKNELGFDAAINYKTEVVHEALKKYCPKGIDVYFDNVGGQTLDAVLPLVNVGGRIVVCGLISQYLASELAAGPSNFFYVLVKRALVQGFLVFDYTDRAELVKKAIADLRRWHLEGKLKYRVEVIGGLENAPRAVSKLFDGSHKGKLIVRI